MSTQVQYRRGTTAQNDAFTGALAEITVDTTLKVLRVHDGATTGGFTMAGLTTSQTLTNKIYQGTSVSVTGNVTGGNITTAGVVTATGNITSAGNVSANFLLGNAYFVTGLSPTRIYNGTSEVNIATSNGNANITIGATSNVLVAATTGIFVTGVTSASGNVTGGNIVTAGLMSSTGNGIHGNILTAGLVSATGNILSAANVSGGNLIVTGNIVDTGALSIITASNGNITLSPNGTGVIVASTDIRNGQANGVGNIGSATGYFNTVFAKATSAQYADLAEIYESDRYYEPGTVLTFGGSKEVTISLVSHDSAVAGAVSSEPAYIMNAGITAEHKVTVALVGRVPVKVKGPIKKGDCLVASEIPGVAIQLVTELYKPGCIIGKALENYDSTDVGVIEVVLGKS
jgi:hypothetical protein